MKKPQHKSQSRLIVITLGVMVLIASCVKPGLFNSLSPEEELPTQISLDPAMELTSKYLFCPNIPDTAPPIPLGPYDEELGDCALRGKSDEIEAWLLALEGIAASCLANREPNWTNTLAVRSNLDIKVDEMTVSQPEPTVTLSSDVSVPGVEMSDPVCPSYQGPEDSISDIGIVPPSTHHYTDWLMRIAEEVESYCIMIDELVKPLWQACDEINFYQDCQEPNHVQYHAIIEASMNAASINYDYTDFFYTHTLQVTGWGNFRSYFNETSIDCQLDSYAPDTRFTFSQNTFCRRGPSPQYQKVSTFLALQEVQIVGRNEGDLRWWRVSIPETNEYCWVSDSTGTADGYLDDLEFVAAPPLIKGENCSKDLDQSACEAAGGTWAGKDTPTPYCNCP